MAERTNERTKEEDWVCRFLWPILDLFRFLTSLDVLVIAEADEGKQMKDQELAQGKSGSIEYIVHCN